MKRPPEIAPQRYAYAKDIVSQRGNAQTRRARLDINAVTSRLGTGDRLERNARLRRHARFLPARDSAR